MAETLTQAQALAVERRGGPILVSAAAGSGKTKVLVERLMLRVLSTTEECNINDFLIITFTKKAAAELRARIAKELALRLAEDPENVHLQKQQSRIYLTQISTVHAFCSELIREYAYELDVPADFRMLDETEARAIRQTIAEDLLEECYAKLDELDEFRTLVDGLGAGRDDHAIPQLLLSVYSTAQCRLYPEQWMEDCLSASALTGVTAAEDTVWGASLIEQLRSTLKEQIEAFRDALTAVEGSEALVKYAPMFRVNYEQLLDLLDKTTWDELFTAADNGISLGRLPPIKDCSDPDLQARVRAVRSDTVDRLRRCFAEFYGPSELVLSDLRQTGATIRALFSLAQAFSVRYSREKVRLHALDFNDLEHLAVRLLLQEDGKTPTELALRVSERYKEIMVDEYQDTNEVQDSLFRAISRQGRNRFMVGDVKQSIYRFRLADPTIFLRKYRDYPDAALVGPEDRQRILLSHNFRSGEPVLDAVNAVFSRCMSPRVGGLTYGADEALRPGVPRIELPQPQVELHCISTKSPDADAETPEVRRAEAEFTAARIARLLKDQTPIRTKTGTRPAEPGDIVILLRSPKNAAASYLDALQRRGIPAASDSGESILDTREVETLICLLKVIDNVHRDVPLAGALLSPLFGISGSELALAKTKDKSLDLFDALKNTTGASERLKNALEQIVHLRDLSRELPLHRLLERIRECTGMEAVYGAMENGPVRLENLRAFTVLASGFAENGKKSLHQFLSYLELLKEEGGVAREASHTNAVTVMSIHKSKGLEFPIVFLCGLSKRFNTDDMKQMVQFHTELGVGCSVYDESTHTRFPSIARAAISARTKAENLSEELRVLYVAMTRAQDMLIMTFCSGSLRSHLTNLVCRLSPKTVPLLSAQAGCMGDWVLLTAFLRAEASALHAVAGTPEGVTASDFPWIVTYQDYAADASAAAAPIETEYEPQAPDAELLQNAIQFDYPAKAATSIPAKLTATQLKGRRLDEEAESGSRVVWRRSPSRRPKLIDGDRALTPAERGVAMHQAMQFLDFSRVSSLEEIRSQLNDMVADEFLTKQQADSVDPEKLLRVFLGPLGEEMRSAERVIREFKFSILIDAKQYDPSANDEQIMLQGVTDCCLIRGGALTVIDFKTDRVQPGGERLAGETYRPQLSAYSLALSRIFGMPVTRRLLYFFQTDAVVEI